MKKLIMFAIFFLAVNVRAQNFTYSFSASVELDSTSVDTLYLGFIGEGSGDAQFRTSSVNPKNHQYFTEHLFVTGTIDTVASADGPHPRDSLAVMVIPIDRDGYAITDTTYFDFTNHDTTGTKAYLGTYVADNDAAVTTNITPVAFWVDLAGWIRAGYAGAVFYVDQVTTGVNAKSSVTLNVVQGAGHKP